MKMLARGFPSGDWHGPDRTMSSSTSRPSWLSPGVLGWTVSGVVLVLMFGWWPYQHWYFDEKLSIFTGWWRFTGENAEWAFCPIVPLVSAWFGWQQRAQLRAIPVRGHWSGVVLLALAMLAYWVGYQADTAYPGFAAFQLIVAGLILWLGGIEWMRILFFPWLFLSFMWPVYPLEDQLASPLRVFTAGWASTILDLIGLANDNEGSKILSSADAARGLVQGQRFQLDVADACSGIRSLYALMMLAALYGYVFLRGLWPRVILFVSAVPLAVAGNLVRMILLALGSVWFGPEVAIGRMVDGVEEISLFHELAGFAVFAVALVGMFAISSVLEGKHWKRAKRVVARPVDAASVESIADLKPMIIRSSVVALFGAASILRCASPSSQPPLSPSPVNMELPVSLGEMQSQEFPMTQAERDNLSADIALARRVYIGPGGRQMLATLVLSGQTRRGLHRPDVCLPGAGWNIVGRQEMPVMLGDGREEGAMMMRLFRDMPDPQTGVLKRQRGINLFWYQGYGTATPDYYGHVFTTYFDSILRNLNHRWALVSFFVQLPPTEPGIMDGMTEAKGLLDLQEFIQQIAPQMIVTPP